MDFSLTDDQELMIESAREYAERYFTDEAVKQAYEVDHHISVEAAMAYREAGFMHMGLPEDIGGIPVDKLTEILLVEKLHEFTGVVLPFVTDFNTITDVIDFGTKEQQELIMNAIENVESTCIACTAISEPAAGSDNNAMTCVTRKQPDGTYLLNGQKTWVTQGRGVPLRAGHRQERGSRSQEPRHDDVAGAPRAGRRLHRPAAQAGPADHPVLRDVLR